MIYVEDIETTGIGNHLFLGVRKGLDSKGLGHIAPWMGEEAPTETTKKKRSVLKAKVQYCTLCF